MRRMGWMAAWLLMAPSAVEAGAWLQRQGEGQVIHTLSWYRTGTPGDPYEKWEYNPYAEYGWSPRLTIGVSAYLDLASQEIATGWERNAGLGDTEVFARYLVWEKGPSVFSIQPLVKLPGGWTSDDFPAIGGEQMDAELKGLYGTHFGPHFLDVSLAYRARSETPSDQLKLEASFGYRLSEQWLILPQLFGTMAMDSTQGGVFTFAPSDDYDLLKWQLTGVYRYNDSLSFQAGGFGHALRDNTGGGGGIIAGVWQKF